MLLLHSAPLLYEAIKNILQFGLHQQTSAAIENKIPSGSGFWTVRAMSLDTLRNVNIVNLVYNKYIVPSLKEALKLSDGIDLVSLGFTSEQIQAIERVKKAR